jgi:DNA-binding LytR/AlgR family response regulator
MRVGICDDIREECVKAETILWEKGILNKEEDEIQYYSPRDVELDLEEEQFACDVMVMDIEFEMEGLDGIVLSKGINGQAPDCQIIYLTHIIDFAPEVYETEHCYFVMKNNMQTMLPRAMKKAKRLYQKSEEDTRIEIVSDGHKTYISQAQILYIEKEQRMIHIYTSQKVYDSYQSLAAVEKQTDEDMVRCHGSFMINLKHVSGLETENITMQDGREVPVGKTYREQVKKEYLRYWTERV